MSDETLLVISGVDINPWSARGLKQTLSLDDGAAQYARDINGGLMDLSNPLFRKYSSAITGSDVDPPTFDGKWPGLEVTVDCIFELAYDATDPERTPVAGSQRVDSNGTKFYRPQLTMMIIDLSLDEDEWGRVVGWRLDLLEV